MQAPVALVEQIEVTPLYLRWCFSLVDDEEKTVYCGAFRQLKTEALTDRDKYLRDALDTPNQHRTPEQRVMVRAIYRLKEPNANPRRP